MTIATVLIEGSLKEIGVVSRFTPSSPEQITHGLIKLNSLMNLWLSRGIQIKFSPITLPSEDLEEPIDATNAIMTNLAIKLAPTYSRPVSQELRNSAREEFEYVKSNSQVICIPDKVVSSTLPVGQGNMKGIDAQVFFKRGGTVSN